MGWAQLAIAAYGLYQSNQQNKKANAANKAATSGLTFGMPAWLNMDGGRNSTGRQMNANLSNAFLGMTRRAAAPGSLNPNLTDATRLRMASDTEDIRRGQTGQLAEAAGGLGRRNLGGSGMAAALEAAIRRAGDRDVGAARRNAMLDSEDQRMKDENVGLQLSQHMLNWETGRRGNAGTQAQLNVGENNRNAASNMSQYAALAQALGSVNWGGSKTNTAGSGQTGPSSLYP